MENKIKVSIFVFLSVLSFGLAQQNLCNDAKALGFEFAPDPSHCTRYLYCQRDANNTDDNTNILAVYYRQCDQSLPQKYFKDGRCISDPTHCINSLDICPGGAASRVKSGNHYGTDCNEFRYCALPGSSWSKCLATAAETWQFDRNTGTCVDNTEGAFLPDCPFTPATTTLDPTASTDPTTRPPPVVDCSTTTQDGYIAGSADCDAWAYCVGGEQWDSGFCPCGSAFSGTTPPCQPEATCTLSCPVTTTTEAIPAETTTYTTTTPTTTTTTTITTTTI